MKKQVLLAGLPGDMATMIKDEIEASSDFELVNGGGNTKVALTGEYLKKYPISAKFLIDYTNEKNIVLYQPEDHEEIIGRLKEDHKDNLYAINFATAEGYETNFLFTKFKIPFISGVTGAPKKMESDLVTTVKESGTWAVIDKNMSPSLVIVGEMLRYAAETFPGALEGFSGYGIDSHQLTKKDDISGTLVKWGGLIKKLGVNFKPAKGDRTAKYGHGDHFIRIASEDGNVKVTIQTEVLGRETYAQGTIRQALPFLVKGKKGNVYTTSDALRGE